MRSYTQHAFSILATSAFIALALGSSEPTPEEKKKRAEETKSNRAEHDEWVELVGAAYDKLDGIDKAGLKDKPCDGPAMLSTAKEDTYLSLPTVYAPFMARFASTKKADWQADDGPWAFLTESTFREHFEKHADDRDASSVDGTARFIINDWRKNRFLIVLWPDDEKSNKLPSRGAELTTFESGRFDGWLLIVDPIEATVVCQKKLAITNSDRVSRTESFIKDRDNAIQKDFENHFDAAVKGALPEKVKSSNNMGALLK